MKQCKVLAVACDHQGDIEMVALDGFSLFHGPKSTSNVFAMFKEQACQRLKQLFRDALNNGFAYHLDSPPLLCADLELDYLAVIANSTSIFLLASESKDQVLSLGNMIQGRSSQSIVSPATNPAARSGKELPASDDCVALDEFMRVNNELINSKRELIKKNQRLLEQEQRFIRIIQENPDPVFILDESGTIGFLSQAAEQMVRNTFQSGDIVGKPFPFQSNDKGEVHIPCSSGADLVFDLLEVRTTWDEAPARLVSLRDITARKHTEAMLNDLCNDLEQRVAERTSSLHNANEMLTEEVAKRKKLSEELVSTNKDLLAQKDELEEMNAALRVLLKQREKDREEMQNQVKANMDMLILPYLELIDQQAQTPSLALYLQAIRRNCDQITSSFTRTLRTEYQSFTANEIKVADLIRSGMSSKDIAAMRNVSVRTIEYYRKRIRSKLGILGKKINLQAFLGELARPH